QRLGRSFLAAGKGRGKFKAGKTNREKEIRAVFHGLNCWTFCSILFLCFFWRMSKCVRAVAFRR
ncbi:MAG: hypothetical protein ACREFE_19840, partial [Limisphaerales bacterium]